MRTALVLLVLAAVLAGCRGETPARPPVRVAAAADLSLAFPEVGVAFTARTGREVTFSFAASGVLARQLAEGAPFDLFAAADERFVEEAIAAGACDPATRARYARGHLVVWTPAGGVAPPGALGALADPRFVRIAIANPDHAPYGLAAKRALETAALWETLRPRLVFGANVRHALQLAETRNVEAAIVAASLAAAEDGGVALPVDGRLHPPLVQALAVCRHGADAAGGSAFSDLVRSPEGRAILARHGFASPEAPLGAAP